MREKPLIMVMNEDTGYLHMMQMLLGMEGYQTHIQTEGSTAHDAIKRERPDLVILDIRMENPTAGWVVLDMMRLDPATRDLPVIVASGDVRQLREKEERLRQLGCDVMEKPFDLDMLLDRIHQRVGPAAREREGA